MHAAPPCDDRPPNRRSRRLNAATADARFDGREVGPRGRGEPQLGVRAFPQQEVAEPLLAAGANQQVHVGGRVDGTPAAADAALERARLGTCRGPGRGSQADRLAPRVVDGQADLQAGLLRGGRLDALERPAERRRQPVPPADAAKSDAGLDERRCLGPQITVEERQEHCDFRPRPLPVVGGERVQRQRADAEPRRGLDDLTHAAHALLVPCRAREATRRGPPAVAVHDDGGVHHASRPARAENTEPQSTRAVACISTNSVRTAPIAIVRPAYPSKKKL